MYLLAILLPPLAVLLAGRPFQAVLNVFLTSFYYFPGLIHALFVVSEYKADKRMLASNPEIQEAIKQEQDKKLMEWKEKRKKYYPNGHSKFLD